MNSLELGIELEAVSTPVYPHMKPHQVQVLHSLIVEEETAFTGEFIPKEINDLLIGHLLAPRIARLRTVPSGIRHVKCTGRWGFGGCYSKTDA